VALPLSGPPYQTSGTVVAALLNHAPALAALGDAAHAAPYKAPPQAPVLAVHPRNTLAADGAAVVVPTGSESLQVGVSLAIVMGRTTCRVPRDQALAHVAGYTTALDIHLPLASHYRPSVRFKARDGFCPMGPAVVPASWVAQPDALAVQLWADGALVHSTDTAHRVRDVAQLIADVSEFMTLQAGDVLLLGASHGAPLLHAGQQLKAQIAGLPALHCHLVAEAASAPNPTPETPAPTPGPAITARVAFDGAIHTATPHPAGLQLADGRVLAETDVQWLPPFEVGTVIALGLNYADHVKELSKELTVTAQDEPLVFFKTAGATVGHRSHLRRPAGVGFMHYECELAVVIGRPAHKVSAANAMAHVAGYTVCNDYAVRDFLENWYRPNLRVKNRDGGTVLGPWLVDASQVADPHQLTLRTLVNGQVTQQGSTANMVNSIPALIEYLSAFMTLQPGDVILTGTPEGVVNVNAGDVVVCQIDGIGSLQNTIASDADFSR
jgi:5-oxopent-3-ene-1,2,5-tricarboxylate decarboxylase/2-hydroxyhepta-2,4-diene-1,7-dioate isomerase